MKIRFAFRFLTALSLSAVSLASLTVAPRSALAQQMPHGVFFLQLSHGFGFGRVANKTRTRGDRPDSLLVQDHPRLPPIGPQLAGKRRRLAKAQQHRQPGQFRLVLPQTAQLINSVEMAWKNKLLPLHGRPRRDYRGTSHPC